MYFLFARSEYYVAIEISHFPFNMQFLARIDKLQLHQIINIYVPYNLEIVSRGGPATLTNLRDCILMNSRG